MQPFISSPTTFPKSYVQWCFVDVSTRTRLYLPMIVVTVFTTALREQRGRLKGRNTENMKGCLPALREREHSIWVFVFVCFRIKFVRHIILPALRPRTTYSTFLNLSLHTDKIGTLSDLIHEVVIKKYSVICGCSTLGLAK